MDFINNIYTTIIQYCFRSKRSSGSGAGSPPGILVDGVDAWTEGNYILAHELLRPLSAQGSAVAQYIIGLMYFRGKVAGKDYKESIKFLNLSAEQGYARAQHKIGNIYTGDLL